MLDLNRMLSSVDIVTEEQDSFLSREAAYDENPLEVRQLPVNVSTNKCRRFEFHQSR